MQALRFLTICFIGYQIQGTLATSDTRPQSGDHCFEGNKCVDDSYCGDVGECYLGHFKPSIDHPG